MVVEGESAIQPQHIKYPAISVTDHWSHGAKTKCQEKSDIVRDVRWDRSTNLTSRNLLTAQPMTSGQSQIYPGYSAQTMHSVGQRRLLMLLALRQAIITVVQVFEREDGWQFIRIDRGWVWGDILPLPHPRLNSALTFAHWL